MAISGFTRRDAEALPSIIDKKKIVVSNLRNIIKLCASLC